MYLRMSQAIQTSQFLVCSWNQPIRVPGVQEWRGRHSFYLCISLLHASLSQLAQKLHSEEASIATGHSSCVGGTLNEPKGSLGSFRNTKWTKWARMSTSFNTRGQELNLAVNSIGSYSYYRHSSLPELLFSPLILGWLSPTLFSNQFTSSTSLGDWPQNQDRIVI